MSDGHETTVPEVLTGQELELVRKDTRAMVEGPAMHPLVAAIVDSVRATGRVDDLARVLDLQDRFEATEARKAYTRDMVRLKAALPPLVKKDKKNQHHGWTYASLEAFTEHITSTASLYGFSIGGGPRILDNGDVSVTVTVTHTANHSEEKTMHAPPDFGAKSSKSGEYTRTLTQAIMATTTSLRRTLLSAIFGLAAADMQDADGPGVDLVKNTRFLARFKDLGKTREEVESYLAAEDGVPVQIQEWTAEHLARLQEWGRVLAEKK
ncbi:MAG: ERF family protein [Chloroflexota bacterium]